MTGETLIWFQLADRLGIPVQRLRRETSSSDFTRWKVYLEQDLNAFHREDHYYAQIAREIRISQLPYKKAKRVKNKQFLIQFEMVAPAKSGGQLTEEEKKEYIRQQKAFWGFPADPEDDEED